MTTATSQAHDTPVLIVGAGPVGLALALDLAWRGVRCTIVDKGDGVVRMSKMGLLSVRSMEFCRRWGIAQAVRDCGFPADYPLNQVFCTSLNGHHIATLEYPSMNDEPTHGFSPEKKQRCPQLWFDPILARAVRANPLVDLRYGQRMASFAQDEDGVSVEVIDETSGARKLLRAGFLVGCDGSGSTVRKSLGIELEGDPALSYSVGIYFTAPKLIRHHRMGPAERYMLVGEEGTWGHLTVVDASDIWRLTVLGSQDKVESESFDAHHWLRRCFGRDDIPCTVTAVMPWRRSRLVAQRFAERRVLLAGDACHVMAPNGGYGMNTGLGDAVDLGWKLEGVLKGWAHPALLESYERERRPVAWRNVNAAAFNFSTMAPKLSFDQVEADGPGGEAVRERLRRDMADGTRTEWEVHGINLGYRYDDSPVVCADGVAHPPDDMSRYVPSSQPGHRAPHVALEDGTSTIDLFGRGFVLLSINPAAEGPSRVSPAHVAAMAQAASELGLPLHCHALSGTEAKVAYDRRYVLVRPDGHVAWRADSLPEDAAAVLRRVSGWPSLAHTPAARPLEARAT